jgi:hypothetical protein
MTKKLQRNSVLDRRIIYELIGSYVDLNDNFKTKDLADP